MNYRTMPTGFRVSPGFQEHLVSTWPIAKGNRDHRPVTAGNLKEIDRRFVEMAEGFVEGLRYIPTSKRSVEVIDAAELINNLGRRDEADETARRARLHGDVRDMVAGTLFDQTEYAGKAVEIHLEAEDWSNDREISFLNPRFFAPLQGVFGYNTIFDLEVKFFGANGRTGRDNGRVTFRIPVVSVMLGAMFLHAKERPYYPVFYDPREVTLTPKQLKAIHEQEIPEEYIRMSIDMKGMRKPAPTKIQAFIQVLRDLNRLARMNQVRVPYRRSASEVFEELQRLPEDYQKLFHVDYLMRELASMQTEDVNKLLRESHINVLREQRRLRESIKPKTSKTTKGEINSEIDRLRRFGNLISELIGAISAPDNHDDSPLVDKMGRPNLAAYFLR